MKRFLGFTGVLGLVLGLGLKAEAGDIYMPGSYTTIQAAINVANVGDTVWVSAGTYTKRVMINKRIALVGIGTPTINPTADGPAVTFDGDGADNGTISGFWITGATGDSNKTDGSGIGILCKGGADPIITNNTISGNSG